MTAVRGRDRGPATAGALGTRAVPRLMIESWGVGAGFGFEAVAFDADAGGGLGFADDVEMDALGRDEVVVIVAEVAEVGADDEEGAVDGAEATGRGARAPLPRAAEGCSCGLARPMRASPPATLATRGVSATGAEEGREEDDCGGVNPAGGVPTAFAAFLLLLWDNINCVSRRSSVHAWKVKH